MLVAFLASSYIIKDPISRHRKHFTVVVGSLKARPLTRPLLHIQLYICVVLMQLCKYLIVSSLLALTNANNH